MDYASKGKLYLVSTPIGNLEDITLRAIEILKSCDYILSEDTRETNKMLKRYNIEKPSIPYTDQKHTKLIEKIITDLKDNKKIALVSDSGTPVISDPGFKLVRKLKELNFEVVPIPGANSITTALSASGLPSDKFIFIGFLPKKESKRNELISRYGNTDATLIVFESSYKIKSLIKETYKLLGNRKVCLAKDLTKAFEKVTTVDLKELMEINFKEKGEFVFLIAKEGFKDGQ